MQCVIGNLGSSEMDKTRSLNSRWLQLTGNVVGNVNIAEFHKPYLLSQIILTAISCLG